MKDKGATIVVEGTFAPGYEAYFEVYSQTIRDFLKQFDTTVVRRQLITKTIYGQNKPDLIMLIDFADKDLARNVFLEQDYIAIIPLRNKVFKDFKMYLAEAGAI
ncbi:MAG TPA: DUF1330 domain-containing protein [Mucilaginibacter sp.]|nr:DUF1330 domain-containing protein [Mucilaginibacter sp.]